MYARAEALDRLPGRTSDCADRAVVMAFRNDDPTGKIREEAHAAPHGLSPERPRHRHRCRFVGVTIDTGGFSS
jgi:hypothetical protein